MHCTPGEVLAVGIDPERAHRYVHDDIRAVDLSTLLSARDDVLERLFACIKAEVDGG